MSIRFVYSAALLGAVLSACAPVAEPIVAPVPRGAAGDTAARPLLQPVPVIPEYMAAVQRGTRGTTGAPGPRYWQQRQRYSIQARVAPDSLRVSGRERVVYFNHSPDALRFVVLNLYQNLFRNVTGGLTMTRVAAQGQTLARLSSMQVEQNLAAVNVAAGWFENGSLGRIYLPRPLAPGDSAVFEFEWSFRVPPSTAPRTGYEDALGGRVLQVAQWYPQLAVYDDVMGADVTPYTGNAEFYLDYGDFDYSVTAPAGWLVAGTGTLQNPEQVLTPEVRQRLAQAMQQDSPVHVVGHEAENLGRGTLQGDGGMVTWRYTAQNVRDVAWATSNRYNWDAMRAPIPQAGGGVKYIPAYAFYRTGAPFWDHAVRHGAHAISFLSREEVPYIYPQITVTEGPVYGMEYPMIVFVGRPPTGGEKELYAVVGHEVGHEWFPMMVGGDEAVAVWMDEGINTYQEALAYNDYWRGTDHWTEPRGYYLTVAGRRGDVPLMRNGESLDNESLGVAGYYKPGLVMRALRATLGDSVFHTAMRTYMNEWMLKHPYPWDFFNTFERVAGRDLDWFWYPWFFTNATLDLGLGTVTPGAGNVTVTVRDVGQVPAPAFVVVTTDAGVVRQTIPAERFLNPPNQRAVTITIPVQGRVTRVEIDPEQQFPDVNRRNNVWTGQ
ncbi:M1 family metallopeptidase [Longimicrobium sp.]|uniref:M1 family metallopeptidase n=1 Tax=Longimicrobium sp. TaxID=2029185 RepID=UPI002C68B018|nr:M1 family metallopeptidase [Longimicrobium sp.]HSU14232.1 M1 family metallopeptidase [Longimicrobium sp.]